MHTKVDRLLWDASHAIPCYVQAQAAALGESSKDVVYNTNASICPKYHVPIQ